LGWYKILKTKAPNITARKGKNRRKTVDNQTLVTPFTVDLSPGHGVSLSMTDKEAAAKGQILSPEEWADFHLGKDQKQYYRQIRKILLNIGGGQVLMFGVYVHSRTWEHQREGYTRAG
jgi:hypothetical protein